MNNLIKGQLMIFMIFYQILGNNASVTILPPIITVLESDNATVRCKYDGENSIQGGIFSINDSAVAVIALPNCTNNVQDLDNYETDCDGNKMLMLTIVNISRSNHKKHVRCKIFINMKPPILSTNHASLCVNVPVEKVSINSQEDVVSVCEKTPLSFQCETSPARPASNIIWIYENKSDLEEVKTVSNVKTYINDDLFITSSILNVTANRSLNDLFLFCSARNIGYEHAKSSRISFNISYPPDQPPFILNVSVTNADNYRIIEGRHGSLTCAVPTSNPNAQLSWVNSRYKQSYTQSIVTSKLEWMASRNDKNISTCIAKHHCDDYKKTVFIKINVLYPPTVNNMKNVSIIEGSMLNISCNVSYGLPKKTSFEWTRQKGNFLTKSQLLMMQNVSRDMSSTYTCEVANIMTPTNGHEQEGKRSGSIYIDVLYPPTVNEMDDFRIKVGSNFSFKCPFHPGNPNDTKISWTTDDRIINNTDMLSIINVSRKDDKIYKCTVGNTMKPTHNKEIIGTSSETFRLIVEYNTTVEKFIIEGYDSDGNITIGEQEHVKFICNASSEPISLTDIRFQNGGTLTSTISNDVTYLLGPAKCLDAGMYQCSGRNKHNQRNSTLRLTLFVRCSPRAHPFHRIKSNITAALNSQIVMQFSAIAFPLPDIVIWQKLNGHNWINITTSNKTKIEQSELNFNLTLNDIEMSDIGKYRLFISNKIGNVTQNYRIIYAVAPETTEESIIGVVIGSVCGVIGPLLIIAFLLYFFNKRSWLKCQKKNENSATNLPNQYESLDGIQKDNNHYSELQKVQKRHTDSNIDRILLAGSEPLDIDHEKAIYINMTL